MVNVPPLFSTTPPPIDFVEDDDDSGLQATFNFDEAEAEAEEFSDFVLKAKPAELTKETNDVEANIEYAKEHEAAPPAAITLFGRSTPPPLNEITDNVEEPIAAVVPPYEFDTEPNTFPEATQSTIVWPSCEVSEEADANEALPSLKLDSLSLCSNDSMPQDVLSPTTDLSHETWRDATNLWTSNQLSTKANTVTLEDVPDDSSDDCSKQVHLSFKTHDDTDDFFGIHFMAPAVPETKASQETEVSESQLDFANKDVASVFTIEEPTDECTMRSSDEFLEQSDQHFSQQPGINERSPPAGDDASEFDDFGDFSVFCASEPESLSVIAEPVEIPKSQPCVAGAASDDDFDDFQDFESVTTAANSNTSAEQKFQPFEMQTKPKVDADNEDDDDFGDFNIAFAQTPATQPKQISQPATVTPLAVTYQPPEHDSKHVQSVIQAIFPAITNADEELQAPTGMRDSLSLTAIEEALALDQQWTSSSARFALIKSLGIDSRNILFGDKWNASMPRYAANLSFDPLLPLKPPTAVARVDGHTNAEESSQVAASEVRHLSESTFIAADAPEHTPAASSSDGDDCDPLRNGSLTIDVSVTAADHAASTPSAAVVAATTESLSFALPTDGNANRIDSDDDQRSGYDVDIALNEPKVPPQTVSSSCFVAAALIDELPPTSALVKDSTSVSNHVAMFTLPMKETHIYTPSKSDTVVAKTRTVQTPSPQSPPPPPVDFDFEIAAAGIIIDETVVKKEYRDVEYNPSFGLETTVQSDLEQGRASSVPALSKSTFASAFDDDFSEFQSVPPPPSAPAPTTLSAPKPSPIDHMILSPAVLLPKAVQLPKPTIEWGDSAQASINSDELARIEELFSQPKRAASKSTSGNNSARSSPAHRPTQTPTISATIDSNDDEWSDFVSVPVQQNTNSYYNHNRNNNIINSFGGGQRHAFDVLKVPMQQAFHQQSQPAAGDDDWSDFVCSAPPTTAQRTNTAVEPHNPSLAWQHANFYNNPLGFYDANDCVSKSTVPHSVTVIPEQDSRRPQAFILNHLAHAGISGNGKK